MKSSFALILFLFPSLSAPAQLNSNAPPTTAADTTPSISLPASVEGNQTAPPSNAVPRISYQLNESAPVVAPNALLEPLTDSLNPVRALAELPLSSDFDLTQATPSTERPEAVHATQFEQTPVGVLPEAAFQTLDQHPAVRGPEEEQTSLVEYVSYLLNPSQPAHVSAWTDKPARFPRPAHLVREPGLRIFSWRF